MEQTYLGKNIPALDKNKPGYDATLHGLEEGDVKASRNLGLGIMRTARAKYAFSRDGGAIGLITPAAAYNAIIPDNAIIVGATINSTVAGVGATATIAVGTSAGSSASALLAATAIASFSLDAVIAGVPTLAVPVKMTAAGSITLTVATANLTAGEIEVTVMYFEAAA